jgi:hypothetical protein
LTFPTASNETHLSKAKTEGHCDDVHHHLALRPFQRSVTFRSGILVIVFICWAWWMSTRYQASCQWNCFMVSNTSDGIEVNSIYSTSGFHTRFHRKLLSLPSPAIPAPFILRGTGSPTAPVADLVAISYRNNLELVMTRRGPEAWLVFISHWLTLLLVVLSWTALLRWRFRRRLAAQKEAVLH